MKNLAILFSVFVFVSCSKDSNVLNSDSDQINSIQMAVNDAFKVGEIDAAGSLTITYDLVELAELTSCAVGESNSSSLLIIAESNAYYLSGVGSSEGSSTSFKVELTVDGGDLYWEDGAHVAMCQTTNATPCNVQILSSESFVCQNAMPNVCNDDEIGGGSGVGYPSCGDTDWPWAGKDKDKN